MSATPQGDVPITRQTDRAGAADAAVGTDQNAPCQSAGANHDNLTRGTCSPSAELPDLPPTSRHG